MIYLDSASTTRIDERVLNAMLPYLRIEYGNPGTVYGLGKRAKDAVENARAQVAKMIGAKPENIIFTSGGSEANNLVFAGSSSFLFKLMRPHIVTTEIEHTSVRRAVQSLVFDGGHTSTWLKPVASPVKNIGTIDPAEVANSIRDNTGLVSVMHTNNETGMENNVHAIGRICNDRGVLFHTDCVQAAGTKRLNVDEIGCDFMSLSSHKIHGPKGVGALYAREPSCLNPIIHGGSNQEFGLRGGTENVAGIVGFGKACELVTELVDDTEKYIDTLYDSFYWRLAERIADKGLTGIFHVNGVLFASHGNKTINLRFDGIDSETLVYYLDHKGICISAGSACTSLEQEPSHVLLAMGLSPEEARCSVRVSFSRFNTLGEVEAAAGIIADAVDHFHRMEG